VRDWPPLACQTAIDGIMGDNWYRFYGEISARQQLIQRRGCDTRCLIGAGSNNTFFLNTDQWFSL
jgi:hypothetical protein